jgi:hypothetical protein
MVISPASHFRRLVIFDPLGLAFKIATELLDPAQGFGVAHGARESPISVRCKPQLAR